MQIRFSFGHHICRLETPCGMVSFRSRLCDPTARRSIYSRHARGGSFLCMSCLYNDYRCFDPGGRSCNLPRVLSATPLYSSSKTRLHAKPFVCSSGRPSPPCLRRTAPIACSVRHGCDVFISSQRPFRDTPVHELDGHARELFRRGARIQLDYKFPIGFIHVADERIPIRMSMLPHFPFAISWFG